MRRHLREIFGYSLLLLMLALFLHGSNALAADKAVDTKAKKEKTTTLNFEDELVSGETSKPELFYLFQKKNFNYKRLIRLRENFLPEMRKTSEDISRSRSTN